MAFPFVETKDNAIKTDGDALGFPRAAASDRATI
jgi:hypothetical protein